LKIGTNLKLILTQSLVPVPTLRELVRVLSSWTSQSCTTLINCIAN